MYRLRLLFAFFAILLVCVWMRLFFWQIVNGEKIRVLAAAQHVGRFSLDARRGEFYTSDGFPLVRNADNYRVVADPSLVGDQSSIIAEKVANLIVDDQQKKRMIAMQIIHDATASTEPATFAKSATEISAINTLEKDRLFKLVSQKNLRWVQLYPQLSSELKDQLEKMELKGITFEPTFGRSYPEASLSGVFVGILSSDVNGAPKGTYGLEGQYDGEIAGKSGKVTQEQDARGRALLAGDYRSITARQGSDLVLTIDRTVQYIAQKKLIEGVRKFGATGGSVVIMDPKTGGVIAMTSTPEVDLRYREFFPNEWYKNPIVADNYEPGSTFKTLVMAAGIDAGVISYDTVCPICSGPRQIGPHLIRTWNNQYMQNPTMVDVLVHSDNTGMVYIGDKLGKEKLYDYLKNFGFGELTNIDLQDEAGSLLRKPSELRDIDFATETFGQGIAVTPIQMVRAVSAIANKGILMKPRVVDSIKRDSAEIDVKPEEIRRVISEKSALTMTDIMVKSAEHGEAKFAMLPGYRIAGKTGTAQIAIDGVYDEKKTIASFVGFAPADNPKFVMLVKINQPTSSQWGSETAAPLFFEIAKELMQYYGIPPQ
jgi:cell division protein FtsI/penicillin-binding protein 2